LQRCPFKLGNHATNTGIQVFLFLVVIIFILCLQISHPVSTFSIIFTCRTVQLMIMFSSTLQVHLHYLEVEMKFSFLQVMVRTYNYLIMFIEVSISWQKNFSYNLSLQKLHCISTSLFPAVFLFLLFVIVDIFPFSRGKFRPQ
jgi:hypothetical protein